MYLDNKDNFDLKHCINVVIKKYNNHKHKSTKYILNKFFFFKKLELYSKVL